MAAEILVIDGRQCANHNDEWRKPEHQISIEQCDGQARRLGLGLTGEQVVDRILRLIASQGGGPIRGSQVVSHFEAKSKGAGDKGWTMFFKYACNERGLLCYKRMPVHKSSAIYFALPGEGMAAGAPIPPIAFGAEFDGTFDIPAQDARTAVRSHGRLVNQLSSQLRALGLAPGNTQLIDLIVKLSENCVALFEVKSCADRDSIYTCIGQLMVHRGDKPWRQVAVLPQSVRVDLVAALGALGIDVLTFETDGSSVRFDRLAALVDRLRQRDRQ